MIECILYMWAKNEPCLPEVSIFCVIYHSNRRINLETEKLWWSNFETPEENPSICWTCIMNIVNLSASKEASEVKTGKSWKLAGHQAWHTKRKGNIEFLSQTKCKTKKDTHSYLLTSTWALQHANNCICTHKHTVVCMQYTTHIYYIYIYASCTQHIHHIPIHYSCQISL